MTASELIASNLPVLIIGAGPSGLVAALILSRLNISFRIIDKDPNPHVGTRGAGVMPRTLELFQQLGLLPALERVRGLDGPPMRFYKGTSVLRDGPPMFQKADADPSRPFSTAWFIPQASLETVLTEELEALGCVIERGLDMVAIDQNKPDHVTVDIRKADTANDSPVEVIATRYVIGADGGKSRTRKILDIPLLGKKTPDKGLLVANAVVEGLDLNIFHIWQEADGFNFFIRPYDAQKMMCAINITGSVESFEGTPTATDVVELFYRHTGCRYVTFRDFEWVSYFRPVMRVVDGLQKDRVFLVGDAAHVHSPHGGQGLNTSVQDSANLAWKLALVLKEQAHPRLLHTYQEERHPVVVEMLRNVIQVHDAFFDKMQLHGAGLSRGKELLMLDINYRWSSIVMGGREDNETLKYKAYVGHGDNLSAGDRAPNAALIVEGTASNLFDILDISMHTLLVFHSDEQSIKDVVELLSRMPKNAVQVLVVSGTTPSTDNTICVISESADRVYKVAADDGLKVVVIRPDGFIGALVESVSSVQEYFRHIYA